MLLILRGPSSGLCLHTLFRLKCMENSSGRHAKILNIMSSERFCQIFAFMSRRFASKASMFRKASWTLLKSTILTHGQASWTLLKLRVHCLRVSAFALKSYKKRKHLHTTEKVLISLKWFGVWSLRQHYRWTNFLDFSVFWRITGVCRPITFFPNLFFPSVIWKNSLLFVFFSSDYRVFFVENCWVLWKVNYLYIYNKHLIDIIIKWNFLTNTC